LLYTLRMRTSQPRTTPLPYTTLFRSEIITFLPVVFQLGTGFHTAAPSVLVWRRFYAGRRANDDNPEQDAADAVLVEMPARKLVAAEQFEHQNRGLCQ